MAFTARGSLLPHGAPVLRRAIVANSVTTTENDSLKLASGFAALGTAGALVFGHSVSISTKAGVGLLSTGAAGAATGSYVGTYTTASDNQTVAMVKADCDISKFSLYSAAENATIGTTTGSNLAGYAQDLTDSRTLAESTATAVTSAATTNGQYFGWGVDSQNTANALVNIYESQVFGI